MADDQSRAGGPGAGVVVVRPTQVQVFRAALLELAQALPSARGMDPVSRANMLRNELENRRQRALRALNEARGLPTEIIP